MAKAPKSPRSRKSPPQASSPALAVVEDAPQPADVAAAPELRRKALVDRIAERTGVKKKDARAVVEATLAELGDALARGEGLNLPPLGKARVNRRKAGAKGETLIIRLKRGGSSGPADEEGLAEAGD